MPDKEYSKKTDTDDSALFRAAMQDVAPLPVSDKTILTQQKPDPRPLKKNPQAQCCDSDTASDSVALEIEAGGEWSFSRPGVSQQTLRRLKRSYWGVQGRLDLHGLTQKAARLQLMTFMDSAFKNNFRCVQIIHGKGLSSENRIPVLKNRIGDWLAQYDAVLAFCQARPEDGGGGAVMVLLRNV